MNAIRRDQSSRERKIADRDSGISTLHRDSQSGVITTQPQSCYESENYPKQGYQGGGIIIVDQKEACCMCKIGGFYLGYSNDVKESHQVKRQSHRSVSLATVDSDFYEPPSSECPSITTQDYAGDPQDEYNIGVPTRKRVSFQFPDHEIRRASSPTLSTILPESECIIDHADDKKNVLKFILQCINDSAERRVRSKEDLAWKRIELDNFAAVYALSTSDDGIKLSIPGTRTSLYIPPFALQHSDTPQLIYIYQYKPDEVGLPSEDGKEAWATPVIKCGPPGLVFKKPVFLTMPYTFKVNKAQMHISAYHRSQFVPGGWQGLRDGVDTVVMAQEDEVSILITSFCKYGCTAQSPTNEITKWMQVLVDVDLDDAERKCRIDVRLVDIDKASFHGSKNDNSFPVLLVNNNGGDIHVAINGIDHRKWKRVGSSSQQIPCELIWSKDKPSVVTFKAELKDDADDTVFRANIDIYQDDNDQPRVSANTTTTVSDTDNHGICSDKHLKEKFEQIKESIDQQFLQSNMKSSPHFKRQDSYRNACVVLDNAIEHCGWKQLACQIGFESNETVKWMGHMSRNSGNYSESSILIDWYLKDATDDNILDKMQCLSNYLLKSNNTAAQKYIDEEIQQRKRQKEIRELKESLGNSHLTVTTNTKRRSSRRRVIRAASTAVARTRGLFRVRRKSYTLRHSFELEENASNQEDTTDDNIDPSAEQNDGPYEAVFQVQEPEVDELPRDTECDYHADAQSAGSIKTVKRDNTKSQNVQRLSMIRDERKTSADSGFDQSRPTSVMSVVSISSTLIHEPAHAIPEETGERGADVKY